jgi:hypothetical protein
MDIDNDELREESTNATTNATEEKPGARVKVNVYHYSGGKCIMSFSDVVLNNPPIVGGALGFTYNEKFFMITGTLGVVFEEVAIAEA